MTQFYPILTLSSFLLAGFLFKQFKNVIKYKVSYEAFLLSFVFMIGTLDALQVPGTLMKWSNEMLVFIYFLRNMKNHKASYPYFRFYLLLFIVFIASYLLNQSRFVDSFFFLRFYLSPLLFFWGIYNRKLLEMQYRKLNMYIFFLFAFQIYAQFLKYLLWRSFPENPVGSITLAGGGVASYLPLIALAFLLSYYVLVNTKQRIWLWVLGFVFVGIASQKRAAFYLLPFVILFLLYLQWRATHHFSVKTIKHMFVILLITPFLLYFSASSNFVAKQTSREISFELFLDHADDYLREERDGIAMGRLAAFNRTVEIVSESPFLNKMLGFGPSTVKGFSRGDNRMERFGFGGTFPGWTYQFLQIGLLGCGFYFLLHIMFARRIYRLIILENDYYWKVIAIGTFVYIILLLLDFFTYSITMLTIYALTYPFVYFVAICLKRYRFISIKNSQFT